MMTFPKDFLWGVATAAYQVEGAAQTDGRGPSIWDTFSATPGKVANGDSGLIANDHYHRYLDDIQIMKNLGVKAYRFSISWTRLFPKGDDVREERGFDFYNRLIDALLAAGIEPVATIYHWDLPQPLQDRGGWASREILEPFENYARAVAEAFGDRVTRFATINEPWVMSWLGYGSGVHAPGETSFDQAIAASHHTLVAHNRAVRAIKSVRPNALVGPVLSQSHPDVDDIPDPKQLQAASIFDAFTNLFWMDGIFRGAYPQLVLDLFGERLTKLIQAGDLDLVENDWLGVNFYFNTRIGHEVPADHPSRARFIDELAGFAVESQAVGDLTDMGWPITPYGLGDLLVRWTREYGEVLPPMFVTENGVAYDNGLSADGLVHDDKRIAYLNDHLLSIESAIARGADVRGYFQWSLMDNFEWAEGFNKRFGIVHVDYSTQVRTVKDSGNWYAKVIETNGECLTRKFVKFS
jgi:beta-glucosidase